MDNNLHCLIRNGQLSNVSACATDMIALPPDATLIYANDWSVLVAESGGEKQLIAALGVEDVRDAAI